jgi:hypothetical protein
VVAAGKLIALAKSFGRRWYGDCVARRRYVIPVEPTEQEEQMTSLSRVKERGRGGATQVNQSTSSRAIAAAGALSLMAALSACSVGPDTPQTGTASTESALAAPQTIGDVGTLLYSVKLSPSHVVEFRDLGGGSVATMETVPQGEQDSVILKDAVFPDLASAFRKIQPATAEVPAVLLEADRRTANVRALTPAHTTPEASSSPLGKSVAPVSGGDSPEFYTQADQSWFLSNICEAAHMNMCLRYWAWADSGVPAPGWAGGANGQWVTSAQEGREGHGAWFTGNSWSCTSTIWFVCTAYGWKQAFHTLVQPGWTQTWLVTDDNYANGQVNAHIGDDTNAATVGLALKKGNPPPPPPPPAPMQPRPGCNIVLRAHTTNCTNSDGTPTFAISSCADGCSTTVQGAENAAQLSLDYAGIPICPGGGYGCCQVIFDQNFNTCGD